MTEPVRIDRIAAGGDGVGRLADGRVVFVARTAPGDLVEVALTDERRSWTRGTVARVVEPSPERAQPACAHFVADDCGGCALQHMTYAAQVRAKGAIVGDALRRIARIDVEDPAVVANPSPLGWRTRVVVAIDRRRGRAGLRRARRPDEVFDLVRCEIASTAVRALWDVVRGRRALLPDAAARITLREDRDGMRHVIAHFDGVSASWPQADALAAALAGAGAAATLWTDDGRGGVRAAAGDAGRRAATVFEQVDPAMGDAVRACAVAALGDLRGRRVWDLYAGVGETTARLAAAGALVESVEADPHAVAAAERTGPAQGVTRRTGRVEDLARSLGPADLVLANPPRPGIDPAALSAIATGGAHRFVYVSCDPATLARDAARLGEGWRLGALHAFDAFPQTAHVETVAAFTRA